MPTLMPTPIGGGYELGRQAILCNLAPQPKIGRGARFFSVEALAGAAPRDARMKKVYFAQRAGKVVDLLSELDPKVGSCNARGHLTAWG